MLALLLALRSLAPAGFMPAFDRGSLTIVVCPDADGAALPSVHHHHHPGEHGFAHHPCPYASASPPGTLGADWIPLLGAIVFAAALLLGRTFQFLERQNRGERPPAIGPPIPA